MQVKDVMTGPVQVIGPDTSVAMAARLMRDTNVGSLPVSQDDQLLGMITDRDIVVRCVADNMACQSTKVGDIMSSELLVAFQDQQLEEARQLMLDYQVRRLPVLDKKRRLIGTVSLAQLTGSNLRTAPRRVVFYKTLPDSSAAHERDVPLAIVHITGCRTREDVEAAAIRKFEHDRGVSLWTMAADRYELDVPQDRP